MMRRAQHAIECCRFKNELYELWEPMEQYFKKKTIKREKKKSAKRYSEIERRLLNRKTHGIPVRLRKKV